MLIIPHRIILHMLLLTLNHLWPLIRVILLYPHHNPHLSIKTLRMHHSIQPFSLCLSIEVMSHQLLQIPQFHLLKTHTIQTRTKTCVQTLLWNLTQYLIETSTCMQPRNFKAIIHCMRCGLMV